MADTVQPDTMHDATSSRMVGPRLGPVGWVRWAWRQLTSMRTALMLLFLLALAAVPGSLLPQRGSDPVGVSDYLRAHRTLGPLFDRLSGFDVFAATWFAAIYVLLLVSLIGCVVPRSRQHLLGMRARPPAAPRNLHRLPVASSFSVNEQPEAVLRSAYDALQARRFRVDSGEGWVAAEKGYLRETGNLVFHLAIVALLLGVGLGAAWGFKGTRIVVEGTGFADTLTQYDGFSSGRFASTDNLPPFSLTLQDFSATYQQAGDQRGAARTFAARMQVVDAPGATPREATIHVNDPLHVAGTKVFLVGHGYAPRFTVRDGQGREVWSGPIVTLPQDPTNLASTGVLKASEARPTQLGFVVDLFPTAARAADGRLVSSFPGALDPVVNLGGWTGDLGLDVPQSVYRLDTTKMTQVGRAQLAVGQTWTLPHGAGSVTFDGVSEWANLQVSHDPGKGVALIAAIAAISGLLLSLAVRRRRVWVRASPGTDGGTVVDVAGLSRTENGGVERDVDELVRLLGAEPGPPATEV
jgi:cytochrome c biogenesis protein